MTPITTMITPANLCLPISIANTFLSRLRGLLLTRPPTQAHGTPPGLLIVPCNSVHTAGMRYPIDVVFIDSQGIIVKITPQLKPWRVARCKQAYQTLELFAGQAAAQGFELGQQLQLQHNPHKIPSTTPSPSTSPKTPS